MTTVPSLESVQHLLGPLFPGLMDVRLLGLEPERVVAELVVRPGLCTSGGILHGGASMAFADTLRANLLLAAVVIAWLGIADEIHPYAGH